MKGFRMSLVVQPPDMQPNMPATPVVININWSAMEADTVYGRPMLPGERYDKWAAQEQMAMTLVDDLVLKAFKKLRESA